MRVDDIIRMEVELKHLLINCINRLVVMRDTPGLSAKEREDSFSELEKTFPAIKRRLWALKSLRGESVQ